MSAGCTARSHAAQPAHMLHGCTRRDSKAEGLKHGNRVETTISRDQERLHPACVRCAVVQATFSMGRFE